MWSRIFKYSLKNIARNKFLSISSVLVLTLLMFFINILLVVHNISFKLIDSVNQKLTISLYLNDDYDKNSVEVIDLINDLQEVGRGVTVVYKNKDDVLEEIRRKDPELIRILDRTNPLPETIELSDISIQDYESVNNLIRGKLSILSQGEPEVEIEGQPVDETEHFSDYTAQYEKITNVTSILVKLQIALYIVIAVFLLSIGIIIYSIIGNFIYYYRDEIYITRLVGGSRLFIYGPFSLQGMIYSGVSFLLSLAIFFVVIKNTNFYLDGEYTSSFLIGNSALIFSFELFVFLLIGGISGLISSRKYLK